MSAASSLEQPIDAKRANILYHDAAARRYDAKWSIGYDDRCIRYVADRARRMLPKRRYARVLDIGCGTGFFLLNLWQSGYVEQAHGCDISSGMVATCAESARQVGCDIRLREESFDLVVGHAVLHHLPDPPTAVREAHRVLRPGGALLLAGEPTRAGDRLARATGRLTYRALGRAARIAPRLRRTVRPEEDLGEDERVLRELEWAVDLHTFEPPHVAELARTAGFVSIRTETEELLSSVFGWAVRTIESQVPEGVLGGGWGAFAYRGYLALYAADQRFLRRILPDRLFYNLLLYGEKRG